METALLEAIATADGRSLAHGGLAALHDRVRRQSPSCMALAAYFAAHLDADPDAPLVRAMRDVARQADRSGSANPFHNPAHSREVGINWWLLVRLHGGSAPGLSRDAILLGLVAAFGHDLHHDGQGNGVGDAYVPFRLEAIAADAVGQALARAGVATDQCAAAVALILCTDVRLGYAHLDAPDPDDPRFAPLADPVVLFSARMLRDADLLPSAGTSIAAYRARTVELEAELALPSGTLARDAAGFFDQIVRRRFLSAPAQAFAGNLAAIAAEATGR